MLMDEEIEQIEFSHRRRKNSNLNFSTFFMNLPRPSKKRKREEEEEKEENENYSQEMFESFSEQKYPKYQKIDETNNQKQQE